MKKLTQGFSKAQIKTLTLLNAITVMLIIGMVFLPWVSPFYGDPTLDASTTPVDHNRYRLPRVSTDSTLEWENNIGGSGNDYAVASFMTADGFVVFGGTDSLDGDFAVADYSGFMIIFNDAGQPISYINLGGDIVKVVAYNGDFLVCVNEDNASKLLLVSSVGIVKNSLTLSTDASEQILDCYVDYFSSPALEPFHAVTRYTNSTYNCNELKIYVISSDFTLSYTRDFARNFNLEYVSAFSHSTGFYMFANIDGYYTTSLTYYSWTKSNFDTDNRDNLVISTINSYKCNNVIPVDSGRYALLITCSDGFPYIIDCYNHFSYYDIIPLGNIRAINTYFASDQNYIYAYVYTAGDTATIYKLNSNLNIVDTLDNLSDSTKVYGHTVLPTGTLFCTQEKSYQAIVGQSNSGDSLVKKFYSTNETTISILTDGTNIILVGNSVGSSTTITENFGGSDIFILKVNL